MSDFDPNNVNLTEADPTQVICYLELGKNEYNGNFGARLSSIFVILIVSTAATGFPVLSKRVKFMHIPLHVYLFARYFGAGVIIATAFVHLMDPAYGEIGPNTCVGMTGGWATYSWPPAIILITVMLMFLLDFVVERYAEMKYGVAHNHGDLEELVTDDQPSNAAHKHKDDEIAEVQIPEIQQLDALASTITDEDEGEAISYRSFRREIAGFLILEFGVIFHSVIIGLNLGTAGSEFSTLYPVIIFHQSFEGLGIGARMSAITFPKRWNWLQWALCAGYGLTTPISIAVGLGLRTTYNAGSFTANVVSGVFDSLSAGVLIYTGLVELLAKDFLFNPNRAIDNKRLAFMVACTFLGAGVMALLGKWA